jgi:uncharacterized protein (DUF2249 family)
VGSEPEVVTLDVRADLRQGREPLHKILGAARSLQRGQELRVLATFEPRPLYRVLGLQGFDHAARRLPDGSWEVRFVRRGGPTARSARGARDAPPSTGAPPPEDTVPWIRLDNRGLEPPQPMIRTFQALDALAPGAVLEIHNDRRPAFLYPHLEEQGYRYQTLDEPDGSARVRIWREAPGSREGHP